MTTELTMLAWTLVLAFVQILLFDFARTGQYGRKWNTGARDEAMPPLKPQAERLKRAQDNLFETLLLAKTDELMESVWLATVTMLGDGLTPLQKHVLKQRTEGRHSTRKLIESLG